MYDDYLFPGRDGSFVFCGARADAGCGAVRTACEILVTFYYQKTLVLFLLCMPAFLCGYIQKFIENLTKKEFERLLLLLLVLFSVFPTVFYFELIPDNGKGLVQMIMVYMIGRYIRMYKDVKMPRKAMILFVILWIINGVSHEIPVQIGGIYHHLCKDNSITNLTMAVILFYLFKKFTFQSAVINRAAGSVFAVFALNDALVLVVMKILFAGGFQGAEGIWGFLMLAGVAAAILAGCLLFGEIRRLFLERVDRYLGNLAESKIMSRLRS